LQPSDSSTTVTIEDGILYTNRLKPRPHQQQCRSNIVHLASVVAYVGGRTGEGRAQAAGADGQRVQTGCGRGREHGRRRANCPMLQVERFFRQSRMLHRQLSGFYNKPLPRSNYGY